MQERNNTKPDTETATKKYITIFAVFIMLILSVSIISNNMTKTICRDEHMYCTGGYLMAQGKMIYRDFSYIAQMPYHPLLYSIVYKVAGMQYYLFLGRLISTICDILVMFCIVGIYKHYFKSSYITGTLLGLAGAAIYVFNPIVMYANGYAWNHDIVILCVVVSLWLFISTDFKHKSSLCRIAIMGALLTLAACMRVTTSLVALLFFVMLLTIPADSFKQRLKNIWPFIGASLIVLIWPVWIILHAPKAFYLNLYKIQILNSKWLQDIALVHDKISLTIDSLTKPGYLILLVLTIYLWIVFIILQKKIKIQDKSKLILVALLPVFFFIIAFIPPAMWVQYFAMPVPFIIISLAIPFSYLTKQIPAINFRTYYKISIMLIVLCVIISVATYPEVLYKSPLVLVPEKWIPIQLNKIANDIAKEVPEDGLVLTLAPLYAIEGNCNIYTELSSGSFAYRVADLLSEEERQITHTINPSNISEFISKNPPAAIIVNIEMDFFEEPILNSIDKSKWRIKEIENGPTVYFRKEQ